MSKMIELPFTCKIENRLQEPNMLMQFVIGPRQVGKTTGVESILERIRMPVHYVLVEDEPTHNRNWLKEQWKTFCN